MNRKQIRLQNLRRLITEVGNAAILARLANTDPAYLSQILNQRPTAKGTVRGLGDELAARLEQAVGKAPGWMDQDHERVTGVREESGTFKPVAESESRQLIEALTSAAYDPKRHALISLYNVQPSAGGGFVESEDLVTLMALDRNWLRRELRINPAHAALLTVQGDSMVETLQPGEIILIDLENRAPRDGIYVLRLHGLLLVKRLQLLPEALLIKSDNLHYESFQVPFDGATDLDIIGRVVWSWSGRRF